MKIGIIIYSKTGNTLSVADRIKFKLEDSGHTVSFERIEPLDENEQDFRKMSLKSMPDITKYDGVIFSSPVQAFSLAPVMNIYMKQIPDLTNKKVSCFTTEHFVYPWLGGNSAIRKMTKYCSDKNGKVLASGIINWSNKKREDQIAKLVVKICNIYN
jgi:flavodoxin